LKRFDDKIGSDRKVGFPNALTTTRYAKFSDIPTEKGVEVSSVIN